jgi:beta-lactam-binding protein with PASTA domain
VNLLVSLGPREPAYVMPDLIGLSLGEVQRQLAGTGTRVGKITFAPSPKAPRGSVIAQTPGRGARMLAGATVELELAE